MSASDPSPAHEVFAAIDHVQLAMPMGAERTARRFYVDILGMREVPKPADFLKKGGAWFESGEVRIHIGCEIDFRATAKAHPGLRCRDYDAVVGRLRDSGFEIVDDVRIPGPRRCHIHDPFGNRLELIAEG